MDSGLVQFVRGLYFEVQTVEGVRPLEIWNGVREKHDTYERSTLVKNLLKIVVPLVNEECAGSAFTEHQRRVRETLTALIAWYDKDPGTRLLRRFPYPPTGDGDQKELYRVVRDTARKILAEIRRGALPGRRPSSAATACRGTPPPRALPFTPADQPRGSSRTACSISASCASWTTSCPTSSSRKKSSG